MNDKRISTIYENIIGYGYDTALKECKGGYPDKEDCTWYHGNWMILRYLGVVSNPYWHETFYKKALDMIQSDNIKKVLVAGTADFSMPLFCYDFGIKEIDICDICNTPLIVCKKVSEILKCEWKTFVQDICKELPFRYMAIVNDAFLSRFMDKSKPLKGIADALDPGGYYITTLKIGEWNHGGEVDDPIRDDFIKKVESRYEQKKTVFPEIDIKNIAETYIAKMTSFPVEGEQEINNLFHKAGLEILAMDKHSVVGEYEKTEYVGIISQKNI